MNTEICIDTLEIALGRIPRVYDIFSVGGYDFRVVKIAVDIVQIEQIELVA